MSCQIQYTSQTVFVSDLAKPGVDILLGSMLAFLEQPGARADT